MASSGHGWTFRGFLNFALFCALILLQFIHSSTEETTCTNIDIRNNVENFNKLSNCTVVEGFLRILLIDSAQPQDYVNISFPNLREITGYLLLYRASGLTSLADILPNLAVIRGHPPLFNYAVVIYEMFHLQEIGLGSLTNVLGGSLFIMKNPNLCYLETIRWEAILQAGQIEQNKMDLNKDPAQCPNSCPSHCPKDKLCRHGSFSGDSNCRLCWNTHTCQKVCSDECTMKNLTCRDDNPNVCCHQECLGGCYGRNSNECHSCRRVLNDDRCRNQCDRNSYELMGRRCVTEEECRKIGRDGTNMKEPKPYWKPHGGKCERQCPSGYMESASDRHVCEKCKDKCPKICDPGLIDNVQKVHSLKGCTKINGSLEISINGGSNIIMELEENFQSIVEIGGFLKVTRSYPLISLNFLKNLEIIRGAKLDRKEYSLIVMDNQNLQELWEGNKTLNIESGKMFFHYNAKLCYQKILDFHKRVVPEQVNIPDANDISPVSNGDRIACHVASLSMKIWRRGPTIVGLQWENFKLKIGDRRSLLGYIVYIKEAPFKNVSIFDGRDACGTNVWKMYDVSAESHLIHKGSSEGDGKTDDKDMTIYHIIPSLRPYTQYAVYVRTYTIESENMGARSEILYFTTQTDTPLPPTSVEAFSQNHDEIVIRWKPPKVTNGNVTHYIVTGTEQKDSQDYINQRDFCQNSRHPPPTKKSTAYSGSSPAVSVSNTSVVEMISGKTIESDSQPQCNCKESKALEKDDAEAEIIIKVEDYLHNTVYLKNPSLVQDHSNANSSTSGYGHRNVTTRSIIQSLSNTRTSPLTTTLMPSTATSPLTSPSTSPSPINDTMAPERDVAENLTLVKFNHTVGHQNFVKVENLNHFTEYSIEVRACLDEPPPVSYINKMPVIRARCSLQTIVTIRTLPLAGADDLMDGSVMIKAENASEGSVFVKWDEPVAPNGLIVSYHLEYKPIDEKAVGGIQCVTQSKYSEAHGYTLKADSGTYLLRIRATSLAGEGNWTSPVEFKIEQPDFSKSLYILAFIIFLVIFLALGFLGFAYHFYRKKVNAGVPGLLYTSVNPEYMSATFIYEPDEWEVDREKICLVRELGQGSFGMVYEGRALDTFLGEPNMRCAVKTVNESASLREQIEFLQEASVMKTFNCHHVVKLLGVVSKGSPTLVIMELMANGDLKSYLRSHRPDVAENNGRQPPTLRQIFQMAIEIADGMAYLAAKKFIHRDLAARNCMVDHNLTVKIGDFGMTRDIYETDYYRKGGKGLLPVRWMPPEALQDGLFSSQSDVWSYGVVLWEMATLSSQPYQGLSNEQVLKYVINGGIMAMPENCPEKLYMLMQMCWEKNPKARPSFQELIECLLPDIINADFTETSFYFNQRHELTLTETVEEDDEETITPTTPLRSQPPVAGPNISVLKNREMVNGERDSIRYFPTACSLPEHQNHSENGNESVLMAAMNGVCANCGRTCGGDCGVSSTPPMSCDDAALMEEGKAVRIRGSNNGNVNLSPLSPEGSKSISNGSIANGRLHTHPSGRTTIC